jgi:hypothetical protein
MSAHVSTQTHTSAATGSRPCSPDETPLQSHKRCSSGDSKDLEHPRYQYGYREAYRQYVTQSSKDRTSIEALEDHDPHIPRNAPPQDLPLEDTAREDPMPLWRYLTTPHCRRHPTSLLPLLRLLPLPFLWRISKGLLIAYRSSDGLTRCPPSSCDTDVLPCPLLYLDSSPATLCFYSQPLHL